MSRSVDPIQAGLDYQARFFWLHAGTALLRDRPPVARVGFDVPDAPGFDDIVIEHAQPRRGEYGDAFLLDFFQVKFHVDQTGALTVASLTDPAAIGATSFSLLQRLRNLVQHLGDRATTARFHFVSTHPVDHQDPLAKLIDNTQGGALRLQLLQRSGPRSSMGRIRVVWREHLGLDSDEELSQLLRPLRLWTAAPDLRRLQDDLDRLLPTVGLRPHTGDGAVAPYDDLIWKLHREGTHYFSRDTLRKECEREGLSAPVPSAAPERHSPTGASCGSGG